MIGNGFESFIQKDSSYQIVGLILEEWITNVLLGETYDLMIMTICWNV
jgi:hypothetical protein